MKLANPLSYPLAILAGAVVLVAGVRAANLDSRVVVPLAVAVAVGGAALQKAREPETLHLDNPALERELLAVRQQAKLLAEKAEIFRAEANRLLTDSLQVSLLANVQYACDQAKAVPAKIDQLTQRFRGSDSLLSVQDLQQQLAEVQAKLRSSSGVAQAQLGKLADSLQRNIELARQGQDARQAQVANLATLILDSAGVLQAMQNQLRSANLADTAQVLELQSLSDEFKAFQENVDLLTTQ